MNILRLIIFIFYIHFISGDETHSKKYQNCIIDNSQSPFDVLPGIGWDNLANLEMGRILDLNFSKCLFSNDNRYLVPNLLTLRPVKKSDVELFSETFEHYMNYTSMNSKSVNIDAKGGFHGFSFGGSFSYEHNRVKNDQLRTKTMFTRVQLRYNVFKSYFEPDTSLFPNFKNRIMDIAGLLIENKDSLYPAYLADMIIRDYGTHVIRSIDAGAALSKTDTLNSQYVKQYQSDSSIISASASASFLSFFSLNAKFQSKVSNEQTNEYNKQCTKTHIDAIGGSILGANFSLSKWQDSVLKNLVPIDRRGDPIYYVLTPRALPELDDETVNKLYKLIREAVQRYYSRNARKGCLNFLSPNFNPDANIDSGGCKSAQVNFTLGGTYQTCWGRSDQCTGVSEVNPLTGSYSCPVGFTSVQLQSTLNRCQDYCYRYWLFFHKCNRYCSYFATFWCSPKTVGANHNGYQFGGFRPSSKADCPLGYFPLKVGLNAVICVTTDSDPFNPFAIKLGGLYSCNVGNPLAQYTFKENKSVQDSKMKKLIFWPKSCAEGYVAHVATIERGCQISFCTETNKFSLGSSPLLERPPFIELNYNPNSTKVTIFKNSEGRLFIKDKFGSWKIEEIQAQNTKVLIGAIFGCIFIMICVCLVLVFIQRKHYERKIRVEQMKEFSNEESMINYGSINNEAS